MSYKFGKRSLEKLNTCNKVIKDVMNEAIKTAPFDFTVLEGYRDSRRQLDLYAQGRTKPGKIVTWTKKSKHNNNPSDAIDIAPWVNGSIPWNDINKFKQLGDHIKEIASKKGYKDIWKWGGDFKRTKDFPHHEFEMKLHKDKVIW